MFSTCLKQCYFPPSWLVYWLVLTILIRVFLMFLASVIPKSNFHYVPQHSMRDIVPLNEEVCIALYLSHKHIFVDIQPWNMSILLGLVVFMSFVASIYLNETFIPYGFRISLVTCLQIVHNSPLCLLLCFVNWTLVVTYPYPCKRHLSQVYLISYFMFNLFAFVATSPIYFDMAILICCNIWQCFVMCVNYCCNVKGFSLQNIPSWIITY
jgi:hypothetical protein